MANFGKSSSPVTNRWLRQNHILQRKCASNCIMENPDLKSNYRYLSDLNKSYGIYNLKPVLIIVIQRDPVVITSDNIKFVNIPRRCTHWKGDQIDDFVFIAFRKNGKYFHNADLKKFLERVQTGKLAASANFSASKSFSVKSI